MDNQTDEKKQHKNRRRTSRKTAGQCFHIQAQFSPKVASRRPMARSIATHLQQNSKRRHTLPHQSRTNSGDRHDLTHPAPTAESKQQARGDNRHKVKHPERPPQKVQTTARNSLERENQQKTKHNLQTTCDNVNKIPSRSGDSMRIAFFQFTQRDWVCCGVRSPPGHTRP